MYSQKNFTLEINKFLFIISFNGNPCGIFHVVNYHHKDYR